MRQRLKLVAAAATVPLGLGLGLWLRFERPWESPTERAVRLCVECGHEEDGVFQMIGNVQLRERTREGEIAAFRDLFDNPAEADLCMG